MGGLVVIYSQSHLPLMIFASASQFHFYLLCLMPVQHSALAGTFSLIVKSLRRFVSSSSADSPPGWCLSRPPGPGLTCRTGSARLGCCRCPGAAASWSATRARPPTSRRRSGPAPSPASRAQRPRRGPFHPSGKICGGSLHLSCFLFTGVYSTTFPWKSLQT